jgi:indolepyruvate ferredoxin oxidoreductase, beta subunit
VPTNILLTGVGGQGVITASKVLAEVALISGWQIKKSEVHGMSQRGGSVESHVRLSREAAIRSPLIPTGEVDMLLAFEALEALRGLPTTRPDALVLVDDREIVPMSVTTGAFEYPTAPLDRLCASGRRVHLVSCFRIACEVGEPRAANIVMLGTATHFLEFEFAAWREAIARSVRPRALEINLQAFEAGIALIHADSVSGGDHDDLRPLP